MFKKIKNQQHDLVFNAGFSLLYRFGKELSGEFKGISYYSVDNTTAMKILQFMPADVRSWFQVSLMVINTPEIPAHVDNEIKTTINFYVETAAAVTRFHKFKPNLVPVTEKLDNQTDGAIYQAECLDLVSEFAAQPGEIWVLNVKEPHSVSCAAHSPRIAYCLQTTMSYEQVVVLLQAAGCELE